MEQFYEDEKKKAMDEIENISDDDDDIEVEFEKTPTSFKFDEKKAYKKFADQSNFFDESNQFFQTTFFFIVLINLKDFRSLILKALDFIYPNYMNTSFHYKDLNEYLQNQYKDMEVYFNEAMEHIEFCCQYF